MSGYHLICKKNTNGSKCLTALSADSKDELLQAALRHASSEHGMKETMALKQEFKATMKKGRPAA
jgi:predicted small metal-binding protein